jgi:ribosomal protein S18 acetylase RimI-like enzyme
LGIAVHPSYQRRGTGTRIVTELLARLPVWRILLVADETAQPFYRRLGFEQYGNVMAQINRQNLYDAPSRSG